MSTEKKHRVEPVLTHQQMKKFKAEIREIILALVNHHGVDYRLQADGQHIFLYSGQRGERPMKCAAARSVPAQKKFIKDWIRVNVPDFEMPEKEATVDALFRCTRGCRDTSFTTVEDINDHYENQHRELDKADGEDSIYNPEVNPAEALFDDPMSEEEADDLLVRVGFKSEPEPVADPSTWNVKDIPTPKEVAAKIAPKVAQAEPQWDWYVYSTGKRSEHLRSATNVTPPVIRCVYVNPETQEECTYQRAGKFTGAHMHERTHDPEFLARQTAAGKAGVEKRQSRVLDTPHETSIRSSLEVLAAAHGFALVTREEAEDIGECIELQAENARLQAELDEVNAKIALIREATGL